MPEYKLISYKVKFNDYFIEQNVKSKQLLVRYGAVRLTRACIHQLTL